MPIAETNFFAARLAAAAAPVEIVAVRWGQHAFDVLAGATEPRPRPGDRRIPTAPGPDRIAPCQDGPMSTPIENLGVGTEKGAYRLDREKGELDRLRTPLSGLESVRDLDGTRRHLPRRRWDRTGLVSRSIKSPDFENWTQVENGPQLRRRIRSKAQPDLDLSQRWRPHLCRSRSGRSLLLR